MTNLLNPHDATTAFMVGPRHVRVVVGATDSYSADWSLLPKLPDPWIVDLDCMSSNVSSISLANVPESASVEVLLSQIERTVMIQDCLGRVRLIGTAASGSAFDQVFRRQLAGVGGDGALDRAVLPHLVLHAADSPRIEIEDLTIQVAEMGSSTSLTMRRVIASNAFKVESLVLEGAVWAYGTIDADNLSVRGDVSLAGNLNAVYCSIEADAWLNLRAANGVAKLVVASVINYGLVDLDTVSSHFKIGGRGTNLHFKGCGNVVISPGARVEILSCTSGAWSHAPRLWPGEHSLVTEVSGEIILCEGEGATISGAATGFNLAEIDLTEGDGEQRSIDGLSIDQFRVPLGKGRMTWLKLRDAEYVSTMLSETPVEKYRYTYMSRGRVRIDSWPLGPLRSTWRQELPLKPLSARYDSADRSPINEVALREEAEYVQALATVIDAKGAPGGVRTRATWAAYRMRGLTSHSLSERLMLGLYRLVGYGERPGPPLLLWCIGALCVTGIKLAGRPWNFSWSGVLQAIAVLGYWGVPSFGLLNQLEAPQDDKIYGDPKFDATLLNYLIHTLLAIPFLTGVLALRNFLKADRPNR